MDILENASDEEISALLRRRESLMQINCVSSVVLGATDYDQAAPTEKVGSVLAPPRGGGRFVHDVNLIGAASSYMDVYCVSLICFMMFISALSS